MENCQLTLKLFSVSYSNNSETESMPLFYSFPFGIEWDVHKNPPDLLCQPLWGGGGAGVPEEAFLVKRYFQEKKKKEKET